MIRLIPATLAVSAGLLLAVAPAAAQSYQVQPMLSSLKPSGPEAVQRISIKNTGSVPITIEVEPFRAVHDDAGAPTRTPELKDIIAFPPQAVVPPGREQQVQVRYVGPPDITEARIYGVKVAQLPVDFGGASGSGASTDVKLSFSFLSHLLVNPANARADAVISSPTASSNGDLAFTVRNGGNAILVLNGARWTLTDSSGKTVSLGSDQVATGDFGALLPNRERPATIKAGQVAGLALPVKVSMVQP
jgi:P pilus assembly chaperone PapD